MARWVKEADKAIMIDGCFLKCHGRVLKNLVGEEKIVHIDALPLHKKYSDVFLADDVPEAERKATARQVANSIIAKLKEEKPQQPAKRMDILFQDAPTRPVANPKIAVNTNTDSMKRSKA
jgi:hypothetical protein